MSEVAPFSGAKTLEAEILEAVFELRNLTVITEANVEHSFAAQAFCERDLAVEHAGSVVCLFTPERWLQCMDDTAVCDCNAPERPDLDLCRPPDDDTLALYTFDALDGVIPPAGGIGFDDTRVCLIADPSADANIHEVHAEGAFGRFSFEVRGNPLPDNPRSSALAAMSAVARVDEETRAIRF